jgi:hypothetical protein
LQPLQQIEPAWDIVIDDEAVHYIPADASAQEAQAHAIEWLRGQYGDVDIDWEPTGDAVYIGRWNEPRR